MRLLGQDTKAMTPDPDPLSDFILTGPEREVDAWWAEKGMGLRGYIGAEDGIKRATAGGREFPHYTTDRALLFTILEKFPHDWFIDARDDIYTVGISVGVNFYEEQGDDLNRIVILAAARAMGLEYEGPDDA